MTWGMEEDRKVSSIGRPSFATSQLWIDVEHGEMTGNDAIKLVGWIRVYTQVYNTITKRLLSNPWQTAP